MTHIQPAPPLVRNPWPRATDAASLRDLDRNSTWNLLQRMAEELEAQNADRECKQSRGDERICASGKQSRGVEDQRPDGERKQEASSALARSGIKQEAWKAAGLTGNAK